MLKLVRGLLYMSAALRKGFWRLQKVIGVLGGLEAALKSNPDMPNFLQSYAFGHFTALRLRRTAHFRRFLYWHC